MAVTLAQLRTSCQQRTDLVNSNFISTTEWNGYIANSYQELYGLITQRFGNDYFTQSPSGGYTFTTDGINQFFALPADFFKLLGVDVQVSAPGQWVTLKPFAFAERNRLTVTNSQIPMAGQLLRVFYVPRAIVLTNDSDSVDGVNGWEDYIVVDACIKALAKEESDVSVFMAQKQELMRRIEGEAENRDAGMPFVTVDTFGRRARAMQYRINGNQLWLIGNSMPGYGPWGDWGSEADFGSYY